MTSRIRLLAVLACLSLPGAVRAQQDTVPAGPDTVLFKPERGAVTFAHRTHAKGTECAACHHARKPESPAAADTARYAKCITCHTAEVAAPMKTTRKAAFHDTDNRAGICYDCHKKEAEAGKTVPSKCADCHKREEQASRRAPGAAAGVSFAATARHGAPAREGVARR